jgi:hypothetical protein
LTQGLLWLQLTTAYALAKASGTLARPPHSPRVDNTETQNSVVGEWMTSLQDKPLALPNTEVGIKATARAEGPWQHLLLPGAGTQAPMVSPGALGLVGAYRG